MRQPYEAPKLVAYGPITECTFRTAGRSNWPWSWWWDNEGDDETEGTGS
jgi:hypothetical protein